MKKSVKIICAVVVLLAVAAGGFFAGRASVKEVYTQTFYASVEQIGDGWILVEGLEVNDINHRGAFYLTVGEETVLVWRYTELLYEELKVGQNVAVTYTGYVLETYPAQLPTVLRIELLDDSKQLAAAPEPMPDPDMGPIADVVDIECREGVLDALGGFWADEEFVYHFPNYDTKVTVHLADGNSLSLYDALMAGVVTVSDLDDYGINYYKEPKE